MKKITASLLAGLAAGCMLASPVQAVSWGDEVFVSLGPADPQEAYQDDGVLWQGWRQLPPDWYYFIDARPTQLQELTSDYTGWRNYDGYWYYYQNGKAYRDAAPLEIDGQSYFFNHMHYNRGDENKPPAVMVTGWFAAGEWQFANDGTVKDLPYGALVTGWLDWNGNRYYLYDEHVELAYAYEPNGGLVRHEPLNGREEESIPSWGSYYYGDEVIYNGEAPRFTGEDTEAPVWYVEPGPAEKGFLVTACWAKIDGKWYFFTQNGVMCTGWIQVRGQWYHFGEDGVWDGAVYE